MPTVRSTPWPTVRLAVVLVSLAWILASPVVVTASDEQACGQSPGNRYFWIERAFCDLAPHGPERASGIVIWNHGISGTIESWRAPAPPAFRLLQARGWDVVMLKRHHQAEVNNALYRTVQRTLQEVTAARKQGYRKVVLAGQSFGGYVSLEAIDTMPDIDAAVAFAPGVRPSSAIGRLDPSITDRILQTAKVGRLALIFPRHDEVFNYAVRGESAQSILSRRDLPYLLLDETSGLTGHGGGVTGRFALRYGLCVVEFLAAASPPAGRFTCPPVSDNWLVVRELLLPVPAQRPAFVRDAAALPAPVGSLIGPRWALLADSLVLVAPVEDPKGGLRLMYRSTTFAGGVFEATVKDGAIRAVLSNKSTVTLKPEGEGTITWTASDGSRSLDAPLTRGRDEP
jgi:pimeloyl-ACP methyl ester carboxylesterase